MKKLYIVFDQIPPKRSGGLVTTYISLIELLKNDFDIEIISIFETTDECKSLFPNQKIHSLTKYNIDIRFYRLLRFLKSKEFKKFFHAIASFFYYFLFIPVGRRRIKNLINDDDLVIVSAPSAGIYMSKKIKFILEVHINYEYFWGKNIMGRMQSLLMRKPALALFRNQSDAKKAENHFPTSYIYNFFDNSSINGNLDATNPKRRKRIIFMGRLHEQKNPMRLLECAKLLQKYEPDFILDIYGEGLLKPKIEVAIGKLGLEKNVFLKGFANDMNVYSDYSLLWLTSIREGFGLVIIEAKANGVPSISTKWGDAVYEVIENDVDGFITDTNEDFVEKTLLLWNDMNEMKKFSSKALENYNDKFSVTQAKAKWIKILNSYK
ncbi:glycosyltransferase [Breznakia sp. OttesenSCG-928-G09]|nr:glycosyltransferase [Breznakia sp. OttesenSCG-928-G09]